MSSFAFFLLCIQAGLIQNVYSQCWRDAAPDLGPAAFTGPLRYGYGAGFTGLDAYAAEPFRYGHSAGPFGLAAPGFAYPPAAAGAYGGAGEGDVAIAGELPVAGTTTIAGQVPILGAVKFGGPVEAAGAVTIVGSSGCGCNRGYIY